MKIGDLVQDGYSNDIGIILDINSFNLFVYWIKSKRVYWCLPPEVDLFSSL